MGPFKFVQSGSHFAKLNIAEVKIQIGEIAAFAFKPGHICSSDFSR